MTDTSLAQRFDREGYVHVRDVFSAEQVRQLRADADAVTAAPTAHAGDTHEHPRWGTTRGDLFARYPQFQWVLLHPPLVDALRALLGTPVVFIPEHPLQKGFYSNWHRDTGAPRVSGHRWYRKPEFRIAQVAIYLQDNSAASGGGLDVVPRSHREVFLEGWEDAATALANRLPRGRYRARQVLNFPGEFLQRVRKPVSLPIRAGDVVAFDLRLRHRATRGPQAGPAPKYGIFMVCSADNGIVDEYIGFARDERQNPAMLGHRFEDSLIAQAARLGARLL